MRSGKVTSKAERLSIKAEKLPIRDALYRFWDQTA